MSRITGVLYLLLAVFSGLPFLLLTERVMVTGDAVATTRNLLANETLARVGFVGEILGLTCWVLLGVAFYRLLAHVGKWVAGVMVLFVGTGAAIMGAALINYFAALLVAMDGSYAAGLGQVGSETLVLLFLNLRVNGYLVAQVFFGLWLLPLGYLAYKSGRFPKALAVLLVVGCAGYIVDMLARFLVPDIAPTIAPFAIIPATVAEFWMVGYLLVKSPARFRVAIA
ncbi:DUF4386 domain-containing protein [Nonomuraea sp. NPDC050556]|uniref:DUF4386 domain-containing protein n=1 Tax=Nonomuraea sp. NPDC050556 TaxID=3364369 RepID=UPI0037A548B0